MKFKVQIQRAISIFLLSLILVVSSPLYALAEAPSAPEAPKAPKASSAPEASPAPEASSAPEASPAPKASPVSQPSPSPSPSPDPQTTGSQGNDQGDYVGGSSATNSGNGADSTNTSTSSVSNDTDIDATNKAEVGNNVDAAATTGGNSASNNTGGDSAVTTGDANLGVVVSTGANGTQIASNGACCPGSASATNSNNGSGSASNAAAATTNTSDTKIDNDADIQTEIVALSLSGQNGASYNTGGDSDIITGDANLVATVITDANAVSMGIYQFDVNGNQNGDIILNADPANCVNCAQGSTTAQNTGNGENSTNDATASSTTTTTETINNDGDVVNNINIAAISGQNDASYNTGGDSNITTGDANVVANVVNTLNTVVDGVIYTVNIFGNLVGNILLPEQHYAQEGCSNCCGGDVTAQNTGNGANSTNTADASQTNAQTTNQTNNATINNNLNLDANTGGNQTSFNTGGDNLVETGDVNVDVNVVNVANINVSGSPCDSPVYMVFVNDPKSLWQGMIVGAAPGTYFYTSDGIFFVVGANGELLAVNTGNGPDSTNNATASQTNTTTVNQTNNGTITNNINIEANTGDNKASYNTGGDSNITTGDANIFVNVVNFINSNFSGRKIVMTLVNVFGSWLGHFVPPGFSAPPTDQAQGANPDASNQSQSNSQGGSGNSNESASSSTSAANGSNSHSAGGSIASGISSAIGGLVGGFRTEKIVQNDDSLAVPAIGGSDSEAADSLPLGLKILVILLPALLIAFILKRVFTPVKS